MNDFLKFFKKIDGFDVIRKTIYNHIFFRTCILLLISGPSKKSLEITRLFIQNKIVCKLRRKYKSYILGEKEKISMSGDIQRSECRKIWFFWAQGIENAPVIVKKCYESLCENLKNRNIVVLDEYNYKKYISFPNYIQRKIDTGIITKTHISDLLRVALLSEYGGTWIDATVYCSGDNYENYMFDSDLFVFSSLKPGLDGKSTQISSWFITSSPKNPIILLTKKLLYRYWLSNNKMIDYFLLHDMFQLAIETYHEEWGKIVPFDNSTPHILLLRLFDKYDEKTWAAIKKRTSFHKLSYKFNLESMDTYDTYYERIIKL
ncbi:capsular polysaccharide synthesis protein [Lactobacillus sp. UCMA15818]|uniref:capsular polysaccharide synthesis protein n=1 Tax=Lactobacillus sp. UCMA15818 TaxID=2583394 RepID=UPI0025B04534|nr:capsular polysaccharide synthesis protein [Lactobacillus sp. UCMA15818]MDN2452991.1 capsular biosynthesis protein [Lactobacillus sp. UCMA15818]